ncbi:MAG: phosphatidylserine decarboxylase [Holosporaceae bacterium]|nr:phosphatidylserine decarboxylase [Holosporaceae bacterium]
MSIRLPFDREAWKFAGVAAICAILLGHVGPNMGWMGFIVTLFCLLFFRDPERVHPRRKNVVVSPADGVVLNIVNVEPSAELEIKGKRKKISVFMSIFDVHVNRSPVPGTIEKIIYIPGKFFNAVLDKSSKDNEKQITHVKMDDGTRIVFVQIAGLIARRIRCDVSEGQKLAVGDRVGIIRFGSRVDIYIPEGATVQVEEGQIVVAGETVLAELAKEAAKA